MKYDRPKSNDWVEIKGADELSMRELDSLYQTDRTAWAKLAQAVIVDHGMMRKGQPVDLSTDVMGLTVKQWDWLRTCILEAARDETIDPEA
jgi:hypothetical protein